MKIIATFFLATAFISARSFVSADTATTNISRLEAEAIEAHKNAAAAEAEYLNEVAAAFHGQQRNEVWASQTEAAIWNAVPAGKLPGTALRVVDCRSTACEISLDFVAVDDPKALVEQRQAINGWIMSQKCGLTIAPEDSANPFVQSLRIYLNFAK